MLNAGMVRKVWIYCPLQHKTRHKGKERIILFGTKAQVVIWSYLSPDRDMFAVIFLTANAARKGH